MSGSFRLIILSVIIIGCAASFPSQERSSKFRGAVVNGSLEELRDKRRVWLIVRRSAVLDASGVESSVLSEVYREARQSFPRTYNLIAQKLNKYMKQHGSISAAPNLTDSDFILFFNVLEIRRPLGTPYAFGELFVIINLKSKPRIIWQTRSGGMFVDDAVNDFISELKAVRGEN